MLANRIKEIQTQVENDHATTLEMLETFRLKYISKKGVLNELFEEFKSASLEEKKSLGKALNELKQLVENKFRLLSEQLESSGSALAVTAAACGCGSGRKAQCAAAAAGSVFRITAKSLLDAGVTRIADTSASAAR